MFDFNEELKKYEPSTDADLAALELSGEETADMQKLFALLAAGEDRVGRSKEHPSLSLEDF